MPENYHNTSSLITISEAREILGTTAKGLDDDAIKKLITNVDVLTDLIIDLSVDSRIKLIG